MDKERDKRDIAQIIVKYNCRPGGCGSCDWSPEDGSCDDYTSYGNIAKDIVEAGYGNVEEAVTEFVKKVKKDLKDFIKTFEAPKTDEEISCTTGILFSIRTMERFLGEIYGKK